MLVLVLLLVVVEVVMKAVILLLLLQADEVLRVEKGTDDSRCVVVTT